MWIHIPKQLTSRFFPGLGCSIYQSSLPYQELSASVFVNGKGRQPRFWRTAWGKATWTRHLSTPTCGASQADSIVAEWLESLGDSRAPQSPLQADERGSTPKTPVDSGGNTHESSQRSSPSGSSSKTYPAFCRLEDEDTHAYVAGLVDGQGCLAVRNHHQHYWQATLEIGMASKALPVLRLIHQIYGGSINLSRQGTDKWAAAFSVTIGGKNLLAMLEWISPYMQLKRQHALVIIDLLKTDYERPKNNGKREWTEDRQNAYRTAAKQLEEWNRKGPIQPDQDYVAEFVGNKLMRKTVSLFGEQWETFSGPLPRSGSMRSGELYERPMLVRRTDGSGRSFWPTARSNDSRDSAHSNREMKTMAGGSLTDAIRAAQWATPRTITGGGESAARKKELGRDESGGGDLQSQVQAWWTPSSASSADTNLTPTADATAARIAKESARPTPASRDHKGANSESHMDRSTGALHLDQLPNFVAHCFHPDPATSTHGAKSSPSGHTSRRRLVDALIRILLKHSWDSPSGGRDMTGEQ